MVYNGASSHKTNYNDIFSDLFQILKGIKIAVLVQGWILPTGGVASGRVRSLHSKLVLKYTQLLLYKYGSLAFFASCHARGGGKTNRQTAKTQRDRLYELKRACSVKIFELLPSE